MEIYSQSVCVKPISGFNVFFTQFEDLKFIVCVSAAGH